MLVGLAYSPVSHNGVSMAILDPIPFSLKHTSLAWASLLPEIVLPLLDRLSASCLTWFPNNS